MSNDVKLEELTQKSRLIGRSEALQKLHEFFLSELKSSKDGEKATITLQQLLNLIINLRLDMTKIDSITRDLMNTPKGI